MAKNKKSAPLAPAPPADPSWKARLEPTAEGYYRLCGDETGGVEVRFFLTPSLLAEAEDILYKQVINATRFPGVRLVAITPDTHYGYGVPVGCVILTDATTGAVAMGPVGFDIGCGMMSARSDVPAEAATYDRRLAFNRAVIERVEMGTGGRGHKLGALSKRDFEALVRGGADHYLEAYGAEVDRSRAERQRLPVDDGWPIPWGGKGRPERGLDQLGSLGGGNHFIELQRSERTGTLFVQVHTGSRGFGHGLATNYFERARDEHGGALRDIDLGYFTPDSPHYRDYLNAVAAGGNFAIINRLLIFEQIAAAFRSVFGRDLELVYEISHNLVQREWHPDYGDVFVHRKGATRAFPAGHPGLADTAWAATGHPVLIPGSNRDYSYILRPLAGAAKSGFSVNHGAGRRLSRGEAARRLSQEKVNEQYRAAGIIVNDEGDVPLDESAACYKSSEDVIAAVVGAGLAEVEHRLEPLSSLKGTDGSSSARRRERKKLERGRDLGRGEARKTKAHYLSGATTRRPPPAASSRRRQRAARDRCRRAPEGAPVAPGRRPGDVEAVRATARPARGPPPRGPPPRRPAPGARRGSVPGGVPPGATALAAVAAATGLPRVFAIEFALRPQRPQEQHLLLRRELFVPRDDGAQLPHELLELGLVGRRGERAARVAPPRPRAAAREHRRAQRFVRIGQAPQRFEQLGARAAPAVVDLDLQRPQPLRVRVEFGLAPRRLRPQLVHLVGQLIELVLARARAKAREAEHAREEAPPDPVSLPCLHRRTSASIAGLT
jgi:tRNA-splicing ligase RtcB